MQWRAAGASHRSLSQQMADHGRPASEQQAEQARNVSDTVMIGRQLHRQAPQSQSAAAPRLEAGASAAGLGSLHGVSLGLTSSSSKAASHTTSPCTPNGIGTRNAPDSERHQDKRRKTSESDGSGCEGLDAAIRAISAGIDLDLSAYDGILKGSSLDTQRPSHKIAHQSSQREECNHSSSAASADDRRSKSCQGAAGTNVNAQQQPSQDASVSDSIAQAAEVQQLRSPGPRPDCHGDRTHADPDSPTIRAARTGLPSPQRMPRRYALLALIQYACRPTDDLHSKRPCLPACDA